jgi:hypothetical protein
MTTFGILKKARRNLHVHLLATGALKGQLKGVLAARLARGQLQPLGHVRSRGLGAQLQQRYTEQTGLAAPEQAGKPALQGLLPAWPGPAGRWVFGVVSMAQA